MIGEQLIDIINKLLETDAEEMFQVLLVLLEKQMELLPLHLINHAF